MASVEGWRRKEEISVKVKILKILVWIAVGVVAWIAAVMVMQAHQLVRAFGGM